MPSNFHRTHQVHEKSSNHLPFVQVARLCSGPTHNSNRQGESAMTQAMKHAQYEMNAALEDHLRENGDTLSELLFAYADINAMAALSLLRDGGPQPRECQQAQVAQMRECLAMVGGAEDSDRPDFDAAVRWHGARLDEILSLIEG
jgi:hypothetical protein